MLAVIIPGPPPPPPPPPPSPSRPLCRCYNEVRHSFELARRQQRKRENPARFSPPASLLLVKSRLKSQIKKSSYAPRCRSSVVSLIPHCRWRKGRNRADDAVSAPLLKVTCLLFVFPSFSPFPPSFPLFFRGGRKAAAVIEFHPASSFRFEDPQSTVARGSFGFSIFTRLVNVDDIWQTISPSCTVQESLVQNAAVDLRRPASYIATVIYPLCRRMPEHAVPRHDCDDRSEDTGTGRPQGEGKRA